MADPDTTPAPAQAPALAPIDAEGAAAMRAAGEALSVLIRLLDREADAALIDGLRTAEAGAMFAELLPVGGGREAGEALQAALDALPAAAGPEVTDILAADYADCFLTHGYRLSPHGSVWLTEERLERQQPMFDVREWYEHYGLSAPDWRLRSDDHLVHELQFVQHLLTRATPDSALDAAVFLDRHLLPWAPEYGRQMQARCETPLLRATGAVLEHLPRAVRDLLAELTGVAVDIAPLPGDKPHAKAPEQQMYIPGAQPSW